MERFCENPDGKIEADDLFKTLQAYMGREFLTVKNETGLKEVLSKLEQLKREWVPNLNKSTADSIRRANAFRPEK